MPIIGSALYRFEGDSNSLEQAAKRAEQSLDKVAKKQEEINKAGSLGEKTFNLFGTILKTTAVTAGVAGVAFGALVLKFGSMAVAQAKIIEYGTRAKTNIEQYAATLNQKLSPALDRSSKLFDQFGQKITNTQRTLADSAVGQKIAQGWTTTTDAISKGFGKVTHGAGLALHAFEAWETQGVSLLGGVFQKITNLFTGLWIASTTLATGLGALPGVAGVVGAAFGSLASISSLVTIGIGLLVDVVGKYVYGVGAALSNSLTEQLHIANQYQREMFGLKVAVDGYVKATGDASVSTEVFREDINALARSTTITRQEMAQATLIMLDMSRVTGLSATQIRALQKSAADFAAVTGQDFLTVIYGIDQALRGFPRVAAGMGLALHEAELANTEFVRSLGKSADALTQVERATAFYHLILEKMAFTHGQSARAAVETYEGALKALQARLQIVHQEIGTGVQKVWQPIIVAMYKLSTVIDTELSAKLLNVLGTMGSLAAPILKVIGLTIEWSAKILLLTVGLKVLAYFVPGLATAFAALMVSLRGTATSAAVATGALYTTGTAAVGAGAAATGAAIAFKNLAVTLASPLLNGLKLLGAAFTFLISLIGGQFLMILAALAIGIIGVSVALNKTKESVDAVNAPLRKLLDRLEELTRIVKLSDAELKEKDEILKKLKQRYPEVAKSVGILTEAYKDQSKAIRDVSRAEAERNLAMAKEKELALRGTIAEIERMGPDYGGLMSGPGGIWSILKREGISSESLHRQQMWGGGTKESVLNELKRLSEEATKSVADLTQVAKKYEEVAKVLKPEDIATQLDVKIRLLREKGEQLHLTQQDIDNQILAELAKFANEYGAFILKEGGEGSKFDFTAPLLERITSIADPTLRTKFLSFYKQAMDSLVDLGTRAKTTAVEIKAVNDEYLDQLGNMRKEIELLTIEINSITDPRRLGLSDPIKLKLLLEKRAALVKDYKAKTLAIAGTPTFPGVEDDEALAWLGLPSGRSIELATEKLIAELKNVIVTYPRLKGVLDGLDPTIIKNVDDLEALTQAFKSSAEDAELLTFFVKEMNNLPENFQGVRRIAEALRMAKIVKGLKGATFPEFETGGEIGGGVEDLAEITKKRAGGLLEARSAEDSTAIFDQRLLIEELEGRRKAVKAGSEIELNITRQLFQEKLKLADQYNEINRNNLKAFLEYDQKSVEEYLTQYEKNLRDAGLTEVQIQRRVIVEKQALRDEYISQEKAAADLLIKTGTPEEKIVGIYKKKQEEVKDFYRNYGDTVLNFYNMVESGFANFLYNFKDGTKNMDKVWKDLMVNMANAWLKMITELMAKTIMGETVSPLLKLGANLLMGTLSAGFGGGAGTPAPAMAGVSDTYIPSTTSVADSGQGLYFASGLEKGPVPGGMRSARRAMLHGGELVLNPSQQTIIAAGLKGERGLTDTHITVVLAKDLQQQMKTQPGEIAVVVNSEILKNGSIRKTIRQNTR